MSETTGRDTEKTTMLSVHTAERFSITTRAKELVATQPYFRGTSYPITFESFDDVLVINGRVPSFHLKQILQSELSRMEGIGRIVNQVVVDYARFGS
jgi:hypothetical protein